MLQNILHTYDFCGSYEGELLVNSKIKWIEVGDSFTDFNFKLFFLNQFRKIMVTEWPKGGEEKGKTVWAGKYDTIDDSNVAYLSKQWKKSTQTSLEYWGESYCFFGNQSSFYY